MIVGTAYSIKRKIKIKNRRKFKSCYIMKYSEEWKQFLKTMNNE